MEDGKRRHNVVASGERVGRYWEGIDPLATDADGNSARDGGSCTQMRGFLRMVPPTVTHNALVVRRGRGGSSFIGKSDELKAAEDDIMAHLEALRRSWPEHMRRTTISSACRLEVTWCFPVVGHAEGSPMTDKPDLDNLEKTFIDCMAKVGMISDDRLIVEKLTRKARSTPCGIYFRLEEL